MAVIGGRNVGNNDLAIMGAGVLMFIDSFLPWYGVTIHGPGFGVSSSVTAWHFFGAWFPMLLVVVVAGWAASRVFGGRSLPPVANGMVSWAFLAMAVSAVAAVIILLRWVTYPSASGPGGNAGARIGTYLGLIIAIVQAVFGYLNLNAAGERLPWQRRTA